MRRASLQGFRAGVQARACDVQGSLKPNLARKSEGRAQNEPLGFRGWDVRVRMCVQGSLELNMARVSEGRAQNALVGFGLGA